MKLFCNLSWHNWETLNSEELRVDSFELFGKLHKDVCIGDILTQRCKRCGEKRDRAIYFSQSEIVLYMLKEVARDLEQSSRRLKESIERIREVDRRLELKNPNKKLRKSVERMNEAVRRLKGDSK